MLGSYQTKWNTVCCHNTRGTCDGCTGNTMAYVMGTNASDGLKTSWTWVRMCPKILSKSTLDESMGLIIFHELLHVTSAVYDHDTHAYAKKGMVEIAEKDPVGARLNAASY